MAKVQQRDASGRFASKPAKSRGQLRSVDRTPPVPEPAPESRIPWGQIALILSVLFAAMAALGWWAAGGEIPDRNIVLFRALISLSVVAGVLFLVDLCVSD